MAGLGVLTHDGEDGQQWMLHHMLVILIYRINVLSLGQLENCDTGHRGG